ALLAPWAGLALDALGTLRAPFAGRPLGASQLGVDVLDVALVPDAQARAVPAELEAAAVRAVAAGRARRPGRARFAGVTLRSLRSLRTDQVDVPVPLLAGGAH